MAAQPNNTIDLDECPACGRETALVWTRTDWPEPETRDSDYALVCRSCLVKFREMVRKSRAAEPALRETTFGVTYYNRCAARRWIVRGCH